VSKVKSYKFVPVSEDTYRLMLSLKWCRKMANGEIHLTKLGEKCLMDYYAKIDEDYPHEGDVLLLDGVPIREEWLAPD